MKHENGFHFLDYRCASGRPSALVVILPGHANHPEMFDALARRLQAERPDTDVMIIRPPVPLNATPAHKARHHMSHVDDLYTWHKLSGNAADGIDLVLSHYFNRVPVVGQLNAFVDKALAARGLGDDRLALFGFSLGGAMSVQMATARPQKCAAVVNHSGTVFPGLAPVSLPDTLFVMGDQDNFFYTRAAEVAPPAPEKKKGRIGQVIDKTLGKVASKISLHFNDAAARLEEAKIPVEKKIVKGLGHTVSPGSFRHALVFIRKRLG